jgi:choline dehydrogenase-like flavoprotein
VTAHYDVVIIGTGAGGGTMARALADSGARMLVLERGDFVPREAANWDPAQVWRHLRYRAREEWLDAEGGAFRPYTHYGIGGNTKFWGGVLYRLRREDFQAVEHMDGTSPAWPIDYDTLAPYYDRAEALYHVHGADGPFPPVPHAPGMSAIVEQLRAQGLHPSPLPLGLIRPGEPGGCVLCRTCNSFPCQIGAKADSEVCGIADAVTHANVTLQTRTLARRLLTDPGGRRVEAIEVERDGQTQRIGASLVVLSAGAVNSAALLLRSTSDRHPRGLANSSDLVGRHYMAHLATMLEGFRPSFRTNADDFQKTVAINDFYLRGPHGYPLGQIQSQGRTHAVMAKVVGDSWTYGRVHPWRWIPQWAYAEWVARATDWLAMTEDLPTPANRVRLTSDGRIAVEYQPNNVGAHTELVATWRGILGRLGYWSPKVFAHYSGVRNTTHQCGTLCFGADPRSSVLDPFCRSHDVGNLFVVDASFFPSSAAVNPGLTIVAQALRVADHIKAHDL